MEKHPQAYTALAPGRGWKGRWYECFGDCDERGWGVCCAAINIPYVLFGWNCSRAFGSSGLLWGGLFLLLGALFAICQAGERFLTEFSKECREDFYCDKPRLYQFLAIGAGIAGSLFFLAFKFMGCRNRGMLREKHGLPGDTGTDCLLWFFCTTCSLCQETRTMMANNVEDGVWSGPDVMMVPKGTSVV